MSIYSGLQPREVQRNRASLCSGTLKGARTPLSFGVPHSSAIRYKSN
jgi:hypothetical protein